MRVEVQCIKEHGSKEERPQLAHENRHKPVVEPKKSFRMVDIPVRRQESKSIAQRNLSDDAGNKDEPKCEDGGVHMRQR